MNTEAVRLALARAEAAKPGPWAVRTQVSAHTPVMLPMVVSLQAGGAKGVCHTEDGTGADAKFIAAARFDVPMLARRVLELEETIRLAVPASTEPPDFPDAIAALRKAAEEALRIIRGASLHDAADALSFALYGPDAPRSGT